MNHRTFWKAAMVLMLATGLLFAQKNKKQQQAPPAQAAPAAVPAGSPVAKQPAVKSQPEAQGLRDIFQAQDPDGMIKAAKEFLAKFPDSEYKSTALFMTADSYQRKNDYENTIVYGEQTVAADPQNFQAMLLLGTTIASRTREFDLDREEKLKSAEGYAAKATEILKTAPRPNPRITDEQWEAVKKDLNTQALEIYALASMARNQPDKAIEQFNAVIKSSAAPDPTTILRLAAVYAKVNKFDEAIANLDKVLATADLNPTVKQIAEAEKTRAVAAKAKGAPAKP
jgi:tetratricopeptide (TPR) repeat protein